MVSHGGPIHGPGVDARSRLSIPVACTSTIPIACFFPVPGPAGLMETDDGVGPGDHVA